MLKPGTKCRSLFAALFIISVAVMLCAQAGLAPVNDLPNPFRTVRDWGRPPKKRDDCGGSGTRQQHRRHSSLRGKFLRRESPSRRF
jgi:hypothetical protein